VAVGSSPEDALRAAEEALTFHLEGMTRERIAAPTPCALGELMNGSRPDNCVLVVLSGRPPKAPAVRVNITLDKNLLAEIDGPPPRPADPLRLPRRSRPAGDEPLTPTRP